MTLIIGIKCTDGVVMAADGAVSVGTLVQQQTKKLSIVENDTIIGTAGSAALGQRFKWALEIAGHPIPQVCHQVIQAAAGGIQQTVPPEHQQGVIQAVNQAVQNVFQEPNMPRPSRVGEVGMWVKNLLSNELKSALDEGVFVRQRLFQPQYIPDPVSSCLVSLAVNDEAELFQFEMDTSIMEITPHMGFSVIGSGVQQAYPFLKFLRRVLWNDQLPPVREGAFVAAWALEYTSSTTPGGVAPPYQMIQLTKNQEDKWQAAEIDDDKIEAHLQSVEDAHKHLAKFRDQQTPETEEPGKMGEEIGLE